MWRSYALAAVPAVVGVALGLVAFLTPVTGVTGTLGAALALGGAVAVTMGSLLAMAPSLRGPLRGTLAVLIALGAALTAVAAWFLMQEAFAVAMVLTFAGALFAPFIRPRRRTP